MLRDVSFVDTDLSSLEHLDTELNKLKNLKISKCSSKTGLLNIITKCSASVQCLTIDMNSTTSASLQSLQCNMKSLNSLTIEGINATDSWCLGVQNLINCSPNLEQLKISNIRI